MSKKCSTVKNPCKICLGAVTQKTGLQCQGACQCWVHYTCLNYTPGKILDIKAGIINVTCPCPDCKTSQPKEYRTDAPFSCNNTMCPANRPPKCENYLCPINDPKMASEMNQQSSGPPPCPLNKCAKHDCKQYGNPTLADSPQPPQVSLPPCKPDPSNADPTEGKCCSDCSSTNDMSGDFETSQVGPETEAATGGGGSGKLPMHIMEKMCNTVGELTNQIQHLMLQMKKAVNDGPKPGPPHPPPPCETQGAKGPCPNPCFCPGNPARQS